VLQTVDPDETLDAPARRPPPQARTRRSCGPKARKCARASRSRSRADSCGKTRVEIDAGDPEPVWVGPEARGSDEAADEINDAQRQELDQPHERIGEVRHVRKGTDAVASVLWRSLARRYFLLTGSLFTGSSSMKLVHLAVSHRFRPVRLFHDRTRIDGISYATALAAVCASETSADSSALL